MFFPRRCHQIPGGRLWRAKPSVHFGEKRSEKRLAGRVFKRSLLVLDSDSVAKRIQESSRKKHQSATATVVAVRLVSCSAVISRIGGHEGVESVRRSRSGAGRSPAVRRGGVRARRQAVGHADVVAIDAMVRRGRSVGRARTARGTRSAVAVSRTPAVQRHRGPPVGRRGGQDRGRRYREKRGAAGGCDKKKRPRHVGRRTSTRHGRRGEKPRRERWRRQRRSNSQWREELVNPGRLSQVSVPSGNDVKLRRRRRHPEK